MNLVEFISQPWPWYVAGPLIGLSVPFMLIAGNKMPGISSTYEHYCSAILPKKKPELFKYDWRERGMWQIMLAVGIILGGVIAQLFFVNPEPIELNPSTIALLQGYGIQDFSQYLPPEIYSWDALFTLQGFTLIVLGGFFVGFGSRYAAGCTSGHAISGLSNLQLPSLLAVIGFFVGGGISAYIIIPLILG